MMSKYRNQAEIDELQQKVFEIDPTLRLCQFCLKDDRVVSTTLHIPEKGNKKLIADLIGLGFWKVCRQRVRASDSWSMDDSYSMEVVLEREIKCRSVRVYKGDFIESLSKEQFNAGLIKFNIPHAENVYSGNGEGVWGWVTEEDKAKYNDDRYRGKLTAILLNQPIEYFGFLVWGTEVVLQCHGRNRPTLAPEWVEEYLWDAFEKQEESE